MNHDKSAKKTLNKLSSEKGPDLEEALLQSEASYHGLFNTIRQAIYIQDHDGRFVEVNDGACAMYGYTREEFIGRTPEFLSAPGLNDFEFVTEKIRQAFAGEPQQLEFWGRRKNGELFPKDVRLYKGTYFGNDVLIVVATDITGQKQAEKTLHESEEYYRAIINTSPDNITIIDLYGTILMSSRASVAMFGLSDMAAAQGRKIIEFIVPEERERVRQALVSILNTGVALGDYHGVRADGSVFPFEAHMSLMRDRRGNPWRLITVVRDISRRIELEEKLSSALARSKNQQQVIADIAVSPLVYSGEVEELARMITEKSVPLLGVERASVWMYNSTETRLVCIELFEATPRTHTSGTILLESEFRNEFNALKEAKFINADEPLTDPRTSGYVEGYIRPLKITSMLDAVVRSAGKNIGLICFEHVEKPHTWEPDECAFACQLADQIALAVTNREREMVQNALVKSDERYRTFISHSNEGIFRFEAGCDISVNLPEEQQIALFVEHGYLAECNDAFARMYAYKKSEELIGVSLGHIMEIDSHDTFDFLRTFIRSGYHIENYENEEKDHYGNIRSFLNNLTGTISDGKFVRLWGVQRDITDHKKADQQLAESEEKYRVLAERVHDGIYIYRDDRFIFTNAHVSEITGYSKEELLTMSFIELIHPDDRAYLLDLAKRRELGKNVPERYECRIVRKDGIIRNVEIAVSTITYNGKYAVLGSAWDITERKRMETDLLAAKDFLNAVIDTIPEPVFVKDHQHQFVVMNRAACRITGCERDNLTGKTDFDLFPITEAQVFHDTDEAVFLSGNENIDEHGITSADGNLHTVVTKKARFIDNSGNPFVIGISTDITERKRTEKALEESEKRYRHLIEAVTNYIYSVRIKNGRAVETIHGPGCEAITGYTTLDFSRNPDLWLRMVVEEDRHAVIGLAEKILSGGEVQAIDHRIIRKDGQVRWVRNTTVLRYDEAGTLIAYDGLIQDITARKQVELALMKSETQLNAIIRASPIPMFVIDHNHRVISWNKALEGTTGIAAGEILGTTTHWKAFYPVERSCLADLLLDNSLEKIPELYTDKWKKSENVEGAIEATDFFPHIGLGGKWLHFMASPIIDSGGNLIGAVETLEDITRLVMARQDLKESEERYSALFTNNYSVSLLIVPDTGRIIDANGAAVQYYGYSRDQLTRMGIYDLNRLPKDMVVKNLIRAKDQKEKHFFSTHYRADGEKRYVEVYSGPIQIQSKLLFYSIIHDITDRRLVEKALRESEERYSSLFSNNYSVSLIIDPDTGRIVDANDAAVKYYGYSRDQLQEKEIHDLNRLPHEMVLRNLKRAKDEKEKHFFTTHYLANGEKRFVEVYSGPIQIQSKLLFYSIIHDITDRRLVEKALRESEERYRSLIDQLPDYVLVHRDGILLYVNPAAAVRLGYDVPTLIGKPVLPFIAPEYHDIVRQAIAQRMSGRDIPGYEMRIIASDGTTRNVLVNGAAIIYEGKLASLNVLTDITILKQAEETIRSANEKLEKRVAERTEALSNANEQLTTEIAARTKAEQEITRSLEEKVILLREIHHRVKNNLQIIASLLNLQSRYITDPNVLESIKDSQSRVRTMALAHERIYRSHNLSDINLKDYMNYLTKQILQFYNIQPHQIEISVTMDDIQSDIDTVIPVGLIMNELVSNSLKHAFPDGIKGTISIEGTPQDANMLRFIYHDDGVGMPAGFDWKNTESLGLRLVNSLVDQLDGTIESSSGEGTTFIITIQQKRDPAPS